MTDHDGVLECVDFTDELNGLISGFNRAMDLRFTCASSERVEAELPIGEQHRQAYGLVHGGVYAALVETVCSTGAALYALERGQSSVGLDNNTSFLRAVREGTLTAVATPLTRGRRTHVWECRITDDHGRLAAAGRLRLLILAADEQTAGASLQIRPAPGDGDDA